YLSPVSWSYPPFMNGLCACTSTLPARGELVAYPSCARRRADRVQRDALRDGGLTGGCSSDEDGVHQYGGGSTEHGHYDIDPQRAEPPQREIRPERTRRVHGGPLERAAGHAQGENERPHDERDEWAVELGTCGDCQDDQHEATGDDRLEYR